MKYAYDCMNRQVKETNQLNHATEYEYDLAGNQTAVIDGNKNKAIYTYDGLNRLVSKTNAEGGMFEYRYDSFGNTAGTTMYGGGDEKAATTYAYDAAGNLLTETSPLGSVTTYTHDKEGNVLTQVDENGKQTAYTYDKLYRMVSRKDADGTATFAYDKAGNMTSAKDGNGTVAFAFDALSRTTAVTNEDGTTTAYTYDAASNRLSITYPDGKAVTTAYDSLGNVKSQTDHDGTGITYTRDAEGRTIKEGHSDGSTTEYDYNAAGLLTLQKEVTKSNSTRRQTAYTYDDAGNIVSENRSGVDIDKKDELVRYYYDKANQLIRTNIEGKNTKYSYDLAGNLLSDGTNTYTYDLQNRLVSKTGKDGTTTYTYDAAGNLIKKAAPDGATEYTYTAQNKLKTGKIEDGQSSTYTYNALNARIKNVQVRDNKNAGHANSDLKDGSHGTDYLDFLMDGRFFWQRTWETEVGTTFQSNFETVTKNYVVDYLSTANRDILITEDGSFTQRYVYDENSTRISAEYGYAAGTKRGEGGENLQSDFAANDVRKVWYRTSHLGSTLFAVDENGKVISHTIYDPWGNPLTETYTDTNFSGIDNSNNYTGYTWDEVLDLYFAQNRFYDPADHRFTQEDPIKDGENWYAYCGNNPINGVDPFGTSIWSDASAQIKKWGTSAKNWTTEQLNKAKTWIKERVQSIIATVKSYTMHFTDSTRRQDVVRGMVASAFINMAGKQTDLLKALVNTRRISIALPTQQELKSNLTNSSKINSYFLNRSKFKDSYYLGRMIGDGIVAAAGIGLSAKSIFEMFVGGGMAGIGTATAPTGIGVAIMGVGAALTADGVITAGAGISIAVAAADSFGGDSYNFSYYHKLDCEKLTKKWNEILSKCTKRNETKGNHIMYERNNSKGFSTAKKDFDSLNLSHIKTSINSKGKTTYIGTGANGTTYNLHWSSTESRWCLQQGKIKIRY